LKNQEADFLHDPSCNVVFKFCGHGYRDEVQRWGGLQGSDIYPGLFALLSGEHPIGSIFPKPELIIQLIEYGNIFLAVNEIDPQQAPKLVWLEDINQEQSLESTGILN
jgi:hypothetical protein